MGYIVAQWLLWGRGSAQKNSPMLSCPCAYGACSCARETRTCSMRMLRMSRMYYIVVIFLKGSMFMARSRQSRKDILKRCEKLCMGRHAGLFMFSFRRRSFSIYRVGVFSLSVACVRALGLPSSIVLVCYVCIQFPKSFVSN